ncbi:MAG: hypothetical protein ACRDQ5_20700 [Sciscionella sp.]
MDFADTRYNRQELMFEVGDASVDTVMALTSFIRYVHVKDYLGGAPAKTFVAAGSGLVPYGELLPLVSQHSVPGWFTLETHVRDKPAAAITAGVQYLRSVLECP